MEKEKQAIVLCSGGLDSTVCANYVKSLNKYKKITILFFDYSQKSINQERKFSKMVAKSLKSRFRDKAGLIKIVDDQYVVVPSTARMMGLVPGKVRVLARYNPKSGKKAEVFFGN